MAVIILLPEGCLPAQRLVVSKEGAGETAILGNRFPNGCGNSEEAGWESWLAAHPEDVEMANCVLGYHAGTRFDYFRERRLRLIRWVVENHPDIRVEGRLISDPYRLQIGTADTSAYAEIRQLWLAQVARFPDNPAVLANAASFVEITDQELADGWLKQARALDPSDTGIVDRLAHLYFCAIVGVSGTGSDPESASYASYDSTGERAEFARAALSEASRDAALAARTAFYMHYWTGQLLPKPPRSDCQQIAEQPYQRAADLKYPEPTENGFGLAAFYRSQLPGGRTPSEQITPKARIVDLSFDQAAERLVYRSPYIVPLDGNADAAVTCVIVVGTDGHVWSSADENTPLDDSSCSMAFAAELSTFRPLRVGGETVRFRTTVTLAGDQTGRKPAGSQSR